jgi:hypothetical protein
MPSSVEMGDFCLAISIRDAIHFKLFDINKNGICDARHDYFSRMTANAEF